MFSLKVANQNKETWTFNVPKFGKYSLISLYPYINIMYILAPNILVVKPLSGCLVV